MTDAFIMVHPWMIQKLGLKGNRLLVFALIYGFSKDGCSVFFGGTNYITKTIGVNQSTAWRILKALVNDGLIECCEGRKRDGAKVNGYRSLYQGGVAECKEQDCKMQSESLQNASDKIAKCNDSNIYIDNIYIDNKEEKKEKEKKENLSSSLRSEDLCGSLFNLEPPPTPQDQNIIDASDIEIVFNHWKMVMGSPRSKLDGARRRIIRRALSSYSVNDLLQAIDGCRLDGFSMGINDRNRKYNGINVIFRDADHIDKFIEFSERPPEQQRMYSYSNSNDRFREIALENAARAERLIFGD